MKILSLSCSFFLAVSFTNTIVAQAPDYSWAKSGTGAIQDVATTTSSDENGNIYCAGAFSSPTLDFGGTSVFNSGIEMSMYLVKYNMNGNVIWALSKEGITPTEIIVDNSGNILMTGILRSSNVNIGGTTLPFSGGGEDFFIAKFSPSGSVLWAKSAGGTGIDGGFGIDTDGSGNIYVTGSFSSAPISFDGNTLTSNGLLDYFIVKYNANGTVIWAKSAGGSNGSEDASSIAVDANGNSIVTGRLQSSSFTVGNITLTNAGSTTYDIFYVKYDGNGNVVWAKSAGESGSEGTPYIAGPDANGNFYLTGRCSNPGINFGNTNVNFSGLYGTYVVKFDANGSTLWAQNIIEGYPRKIFVNSIGSILVASSINDGFCFFKLNSTGNLIWIKNEVGMGYHDIVSAQEDIFGNIFIGGSILSPTLTLGSFQLNNASMDINNYDFFIAKLGTSNGTNDLYENSNTNSISIFPNPGSSSFNLKYYEAFERIEVLNADGKQVPCQFLNNILEIQNAQPGIYFVKVYSDNMCSTSKLVIQ